MDTHLKTGLITLSATRIIWHIAVMLLTPLIVTFGLIFGLQGLALSDTVSLIIIFATLALMFLFIVLAVRKWLMVRVNIVFENDRLVLTPVAFHPLMRSPVFIRLNDLRRSGNADDFSLRSFIVIRSGRRKWFLGLAPADKEADIEALSALLNEKLIEPGRADHG